MQWQSLDLRMYLSGQDGSVGTLSFPANKISAEYKNISILYIVLPVILQFFYLKQFKDGFLQTSLTAMVISVLLWNPIKAIQYMH